MPNVETARTIPMSLGRFLSVHRFYRCLSVRAGAEAARAFFEGIDAPTKKLVITWHAFDLEKIDEWTAEVLALPEAKRGEARARRKRAK